MASQYIYLNVLISLGDKKPDDNVVEVESGACVKFVSRTMNDCCQREQLQRRWVLFLYS